MWTGKWVACVCVSSSLMCFSAWSWRSSTTDPQPSSEHKLPNHKLAFTFWKTWWTQSEAQALITRSPWPRAVTWPSVVCLCFLFPALTASQGWSIETITHNVTSKPRTNIHVKIKPVLGALVLFSWQVLLI